MTEMVELGSSGVRVPPLGLGVMTWGVATGLQRLMPAKSAYGGTNAGDEQAAFDASLAAQVNFFDTAAMYSGGGSERRLGELAQGKPVIMATKFPPSPFGRTEDLPAALGASLARLQRDSVDLYQHHFPSRRVDISRLMMLMADAVEAGQVACRWGQQLHGRADARCARGVGASADFRSRRIRCSTRCCTGGPRSTGCSLHAVNWVSP